LLSADPSGILIKFRTESCCLGNLSQNPLRFRTEIQYPQIHPEFLSKTGQNHESEHFCPPSPPSPPSHQQMDFCQDFGHIKSRLHTMKRTDRERSEEHTSELQ